MSPKLEKVIGLFFNTEEEREKGNFSKEGRAIFLVIFFVCLGGILFSLFEGLKYGWEPIEIIYNGYNVVINPLEKIIGLTLIIVLTGIFFLVDYLYTKWINRKKK